MPMFHGYTIYADAPSATRHGWTVRAYCDDGATHLHSSEGCDTLSLGLREVERAITEDINARIERRAA